MRISGTGAVFLLSLFGGCGDRAKSILLWTNLGGKPHAIKFSLKSASLVLPDGSLEQIRMIRSAWLYGILLMMCLGWQEG